MSEHEFAFPGAPRTLPTGVYDRAIPHGCWENAYRFARRRTLHYVEGFATPATSSVAVAHAFCVDDAGTVIDPSWPDGVSYRGVLLPRWFVAAQWRRPAWAEPHATSIVENALAELSVVPGLTTASLEAAVDVGRRISSRFTPPPPAEA